MFSGELKAAAAKLQKEQAERAERERQHVAKEQLLAQRQKKRQQQREEEARAKRLEAAAAAAAEAERHQHDLEENRGVSLRVQLAAAPVNAGTIAARGIKRAADKLILPPSVGASLMAQDAPKNGAMMFEVAAANGSKTHAGVLEFSAPEGVVLLPQKVADCLWGLPGSRNSTDGGSVPASAAPAGPSGSNPEEGPGGSNPEAGRHSSPAGNTNVVSSRCCGHVWVQYKRLPKGTYVRFQPELRTFHEVVGQDPELLRHLLEESLHGYCTLSSGDWVQVQYMGLQYNLRVLEVQPGPAVSVIDTDMAADVGPSIETEGYLRAQEEQRNRDAEKHRQLQGQAVRAAAEAHAAEEAAQAVESQRQADEAARRLQMQAEKAALLSPETPVDSAMPYVTLMFRLPDGTRLSRRFGLQQLVRELYDFCDSKGAGGEWPGTYKLVLQYPRRVLSADGDDTSLAQTGLIAGQHLAVYVEHQD